MGDLRDQVRDGQSALEKLMGSIPGFKGYQEQEDRRDADKLLRQHLVGLLSDVGDRVNRLQSELSAKREFKPVTDLNRVSRRLMRLRDRIEHAGYGYAGFFDPIKIDAAALDRLYEYDLGLREHLGKVDEAATSLLGAAAEDRAERLAALTTALDELDRMMDHRHEAIAQIAP